VDDLKQSIGERERGHHDRSGGHRNREVLGDGRQQRIEEPQVGAGNERGGGQCKKGGVHGG